MYRISKRFEFSASHRNPDVAPDNPCFQDHGHNYEVIATFKSDSLNNEGFVIDFGELNALRDWLSRDGDGGFDHSCLNDTIRNPTSEHLARIIGEACPWGNPNIPVFLLESIEVRETPKTSAIWSRI